MAVGEIGLPRRDFLFEVRHWEVRRIIRGYQRRKRDMWSAARWHAFNVMAAMPLTDLTKAGIYKPGDLIRFPWDDAPADIPTEEETEELAKLLRDQRRNGGG